MKLILSRSLKVGCHLSMRYCSSEIRVRFAPSPTGYLHLGGLRTALYNFLLARSQKGKFILRIEDTDRKRLVPGAAEALENDLNWVGLKLDESPLQGGEFGPYVQSERTQLYQNEAHRLVENGSAYYCFCSERRLEMLRKNAIKNREVPKYDNHCRNLTREEIQNKLQSNKDKCIRFKLSQGDGFDDLIYGKLHYSVENVEGDPVIIKQDGLPTYHLASVVDDHHMKISHVIRGVEWLQSTDKHLMIYRALGYKPPVFAHLPLLLNSDGSKLSKRQGDITINSLRSKGVEPRALINFLSSVGGGFVKDKPNNNIPVEELSNYFDINLINSNSCKLPLDKLNEYNRNEIIRLVNDPFQLNILIDKLKKSLIDKFSKDNSNLELDNSYIENVLKYFSNRINYLDDLTDKNLSFLWIKPTLNRLNENSLNLLVNLVDILTNVEFTKASLAPILKEFSSCNNITFKELMLLLRSVLCGIKEGPSVAEMMELMGKETTLLRLNAALQYNLSLKNQVKN